MKIMEWLSVRDEIHVVRTRIMWKEMLFAWKGDNFTTT